VNSGSTSSLTAGVGAGSLLLVFGYASYQEYQQSPVVSKTWAGLSLGISSILTLVMGLRYRETNNFMPAGLIAATSAGMSAFYIMNLLSKKKPNYKK